MFYLRWIVVMDKVVGDWLLTELFADWQGVLWSLLSQILRRLHADWQGQKGRRDLCLQQSQ